MYVNQSPRLAFQPFTTPTWIRGRDASSASSLTHSLKHRSQLGEPKKTWLGISFIIFHTVMVSYLSGKFQGLEALAMTFEISVLALEILAMSFSSSQYLEQQCLNIHGHPTQIMNRDQLKRSNKKQQKRCSG